VQIDILIIKIFPNRGVAGMVPSRHGPRSQMVLALKLITAIRKKKECNSSPRSGSRSLCPFRVAARDKGFTIDSSTAFHDPELAYLPHVMTSIPESSLLPHLSNKKQPPCCKLNSKTIYPAGGNINRALSEPDSVPTNEIDVFSSKSVDLLPYSVV